MTTIRRNAPIYIVRTDSEDGIYEADPYLEEDHQREQLAYRLLGQLVHGLPGSKDMSERVEAPATGYTPGFTNTPPASQGRATGFGSAEFVGERPAPRRRAARNPYCVVVTEEGPGKDIVGFFHVPRHAIRLTFWKAMLILMLLIALITLLASLGAGLMIGLVG